MRLIHYFCLALCFMILVLQWQLWRGQNNYFQNKAVATQIDEIRAHNLSLEQRNQRLKAQIVDLKTGTDASEEMARSQLGLIKEGEVFYFVTEDQP